jgi:class 3 adenylate cyclase/glyoxylase-like metal-dependent hydrolase (beta-lactamase superfamily II)
VDGDEAVLFDPGPGHPIFRDLILQKITQIIKPVKIKYIVAHHQDPDLCGLIPFVENLLHPDVIIICHPRTALFIPYYGVRKSILPVGDEDSLELKSGRKIIFYHLPYMHFPGNMMSYDEKSKSVFSSDIFAVFNRNWSLYADESYVRLAKTFLTQYVSGKDELRYAYKKFSSLEIERILPQHGGVIEKNINQFVEMLKDVEPGLLLKELENKPDEETENKIFELGKAWLKEKVGIDADAKSLRELMEVAMQEGPSTVSLFIKFITQKADAMGVSNPMTYGRVHNTQNIRSTEANRLVDSIRKRFLSRRYGMDNEEAQDVESILHMGLSSFRIDLCVMFVDIRRFTKWSDGKSPKEVTQLLNRQHDLISRIITSHGGRINKVLGDGLLAYFPAKKCGECITVAREIHERIKANNLLEMGIGCDVGEVIMGDLGEDARLDYTLLGVIVNAASRMCDSADKNEVVITQNFYDELPTELQETLSDCVSFEKIEVQIKPYDPKIKGIRFRFF